jgi:peptide/nickel transport system substrate-binding protein
MRSLKPLFAACAVLALVLIPTTGASAATGDNGSAGDNVMRVPMAGSQIDSLNPFLATFQASLNILGLEYDSLARQGLPDRGIVPSLAKGWKVDGNTWTYTLRPGLKWSDGKPLTATDVAWTYEQVITNPKLAVSSGSVVANVASVEAVNATTFKLVTKAPTAVNPGQLAIVPKHIWSTIAAPDKYTNLTKVVGSGPFILSKYGRTTSATMTANPHYWRGKPKLDAVVFVNYKNTDAAVLALRSGEIDMVSGMNASQYKALGSVKGITRVQVPSQHYWGLSVNPGATTLDNKPIGTGAVALQDPVFRNAIRQALDTKKLVDKVLNGYGSTGAEIMPPGTKTYFWDDKSVVQPYSPEEANKKLDAAGYTKGPDGYRVDKTGKTIDLKLAFNASDTPNTTTASFIQPWLKEIGVKVTLNPTNWDEMSADALKGTYDMYVNGWGVQADPDFMLFINTCATRPSDASGANNATSDNWCDPEFDALYKKQHAETDQAKRVELVNQALTVHYKAAVADILYYDDSLEAYRSSRISGLTPMSGDVDNYWAYGNAKVISVSSDGGSALGWVFGIIGVVVVAGVIVWIVVARRRKGSDTRE